MTIDRIYADTNKWGITEAGEYYLILTTRGTYEGLKKKNIELTEGLFLQFWMDDGDDDGNYDPLHFEGTVHYDAKKQHWIVIVDEGKWSHASQDRALDPSTTSVYNGVY